MLVARWRHCWLGPTLLWFPASPGRSGMSWRRQTLVAHQAVERTLPASSQMQGWPSRAARAYRLPRGQVRMQPEAGPGRDSASTSQILGSWAFKSHLSHHPASHCFLSLSFCSCPLGTINPLPRPYGLPGVGGEGRKVGSQLCVIPRWALGWGPSPAFLCLLRPRHVISASPCTHNECSHLLQNQKDQSRFSKKCSAQFIADVSSFVGALS